MSEKSPAEESFFEYVDLALENHENFQLGFEDARTAFNECFEDHEPYDIADHAHYSAYKDLEAKLEHEQITSSHYSVQVDELKAKLAEAEKKNIEYAEFKKLAVVEFDRQIKTEEKLSIAIEALERIDSDCPVNPRLFTKEALEQIRTKTMRNERI